MSARLVIVVEVNVDPSRVDPEEVAEEILDAYEAERSHRVMSYPTGALVSAEWRP